MGVIKLITALAGLISDILEFIKELRVKRSLDKADETYDKNNAAIDRALGADSPIGMRVDGEGKPSRAPDEPAGLSPGQTSGSGVGERRTENGELTAKGSG